MAARHAPGQCRARHAEERQQVSDQSRVRGSQSWVREALAGSATSGRSFSSRNAMNDASGPMARSPARPGRAHRGQVIEAPAHLAGAVVGREHQTGARADPVAALARTASSQAALRRSCQEITGESASPVRRFQHAMLERWVARPAATTRRPADAARVQTSPMAGGIEAISSAGSCSTRLPSSLRRVATGATASSTFRPAVSNRIARLAWPP